MKIAAYSSCLLLIALLANFTQAADKANEAEKKLQQLDQSIKNMSADEAARSYYRARSNQDYLTMWAHVPKSVQNDFNELIHVFAETMDKDLWVKFFSLGQKTGKVFKEKKKFLINGVITKNNTPKPNKENCEKIAMMFEAVFESDLKDLEKLKKIDMGKFLANTLPKIASSFDDEDKDTKIKKELEEQKKLNELKIEVVKKNDKFTTLKITFEGKTSTEIYERVDGKWSPILQKEWKKDFKDAKISLKTFNKELAKSKTKYLEGLKYWESIIDDALNAKTQDDFDKAVIGFLISFDLIQQNF